jgi:hypothetical protein
MEGWQMAEERKDFRQKGGDQGGFGIRSQESPSQEKVIFILGCVRSSWRSLAKVNFRPPNPPILGGTRV